MFTCKFPTLVNMLSSLLNFRLLTTSIIALSVLHLTFILHFGLLCNLSRYECIVLLEFKLKWWVYYFFPPVGLQVSLHSRAPLLRMSLHHRILLRAAQTAAVLRSSAAGFVRAPFLWRERRTSMWWSAVSAMKPRSVHSIFRDLIWATECRFSKEVQYWHVHCRQWPAVVWSIKHFLDARREPAPRKQ